jgi:hypothetical protein
MLESAHGEERNSVWKQEREIEVEVWIDGRNKCRKKDYKE